MTAGVTRSGTSRTRTVTYLRGVMNLQHVAGFHLITRFERFAVFGDAAVLERFVRFAATPCQPRHLHELIQSHRVRYFAAGSARAATKRAVPMAQPRAAHRGVNILDDSKPMWRIMVVFLIPLVLSNVLQSASQTMASIWIGRLISTQALGAISAVFPIIFLLFSFVFGVSSGSSVLSDRPSAPKIFIAVKKIAGTVLGAALYLGIIVAVLGYFGSPTVLKWLATPPDILASVRRLCTRYFPYDAGILRLLRLCDHLARDGRLGDALLRTDRFERAGYLRSRRSSSSVPSGCRSSAS